MKQMEELQEVVGGHKGSRWRKYRKYMIEIQEIDGGNKGSR